AMARSLAATWAITSAFFSCGYLDVSVPRVPPPVSRSDRSLHLPGCPIQKSVDHCALAAPYRVSPLGTSFIGTLPLGIPQKPCVTLNVYNTPHAFPPPTTTTIKEIPEDKRASMQTLRRSYCSYASLKDGSQKEA